MGLRTISLAALTLILGLAWAARPVEAQESAFRDAVRELATTTADRFVIHKRMALALTEWDRQLANLRPEGDALVRHQTLGLAYHRRGRLNEAVREFDAVLALHPTPSFASDIHLDRALTLEAAGKADDASEAFRMAWAGDVTNPGKAYVAIRRGRLDEGAAARARQVLLDAYTRVLNGDNRFPAPLVRSSPDVIPDTFSPLPIAGDGRLDRVFALLAAGKLDEATAALGDDRPAASPDDSARARIARAGVAEREGRLSDARRDYTAAIEGTLSGRHALYVAIGRLAQVDGDSEAAIDAFAHAVRLNPGSPVLRRELGSALVAGGRFEEAFTELVIALLASPQDAEVLAAIGQLFLDADRAEDAIAPLRGALAVKADRFQTHYALAVALSRTGRTDEAKQEFERFERLSRQAIDERRRTVAGQ
jgi:tetratricopeptide (TPR) repeat protein